MLPLPPTHDVLDALRLLVLPAAGGAALVYAAFLCLGRWAGAVGSAAGATVGYVWANYTFDTLAWDGTGRLTPWAPDDPLKGWQLLPQAGLVLVLVGLTSRWAGRLVGRYASGRWWWAADAVTWLLRADAVRRVGLGVALLTAGDESGWAAWALPAVMLATWAVYDGLARSGAGGQVAAYQTAVCFAAGGLLLYHHWANAMEVAVAVGAAMGGVAVVAGATKADASGAVPAGVGVVPGLLVAGRLSVDDSPVPVAAVWLVALAPLVLLPFLVPRLSRRNGWAARVGRATLVAVPLTVALALAARYGKLAFEE